LLLSSSSDNNKSLNNIPPRPPHHSRSTNKQQRDVLILGGGLAGLSVALYLSQLDPSRHITILDRDDTASQNGAVASFAAAGMLAPQSERLPQGPLLDLCLASRTMMPDFCDWVETLAKDSGTEGYQYLWTNQRGNSQKEKSTASLTTTTDDNPWSVGYLASGGFLAPALAGDSVATWAPPADSGAATWLDATQVRELEPNLHPTNVVGGWWFPQDASVDARRLTCSMRAACVTAGVQLMLGPEYEVASLDLVNESCRGVWLNAQGGSSQSKYIAAKTVLVANGAWMRNLLPVPIQPHKGQSLSLRMPSDRPPILRRVLFAQDSYIVPKADGRIVIGATVEAGSYDANVTPAGLLHILSHALQLVPGLKDLPIEETWAGLRPTTPDKGPILGKSPWENLFVAGGYWRNGVLLAPKTGELVAQLIAGLPMSDQDEALLKAFAWDRFTEQGSGAKLAANARYAASMHPIHSRTSGLGVAASVGTELGSYSTARSAAEERSRDRGSLWGDDSDSEASFERAAQLGKQDASAYTFGEDKSTVKAETTSSLSGAKEFVATLEPYEGSADAYTVASSTASDLGNGNNVITLSSVSKVAQSTAGSAKSPPAYNEQTYDGYQDIQQANTSEDRRDEIDAMRKAMRRNREGSESVDDSAFTEAPTIIPPPKATTASQASRPSPMDFIYQKIKANKEKQTATLSTTTTQEEKRPDPGFRIYFEDPETGENIEVPPFTSQAEFHESLKKRQASTAGSKLATRPAEAVINGSSSTTIKGSSSESVGDYNEKTYDGYQDIQALNSRTTREEELLVMREARRRNRMGQTSIDSSKIGAQRLDEDEIRPC
jgi:glycine oxidase